MTFPSTGNRKKGGEEALTSLIHSPIGVSLPRPRVCYEPPEYRLDFVVEILWAQGRDSFNHQTWSKHNGWPRTCQQTSWLLVFFRETDKSELSQNAIFLGEILNTEVQRGHWTTKFYPSVKSPVEYKQSPACKWSTAVEVKNGQSLKKTNNKNKKSECKEVSW